MVDQLECLGPKIVMNGPIVRQLCVWEWTYCTPAMCVGMDLLYASYVCGNGPILRQLCVWEWTYCTPAMCVGMDLLYASYVWGNGPIVRQLCVWEDLNDW